MGFLRFLTSGSEERFFFLLLLLLLCFTLSRAHVRLFYGIKLFEVRSSKVFSYLLFALLLYLSPQALIKL